MKKLQANIIGGIYSYFSRQFNVITEWGNSRWEVTMGVEINGKIIEFITIDHSFNWKSENRVEEFESEISTTLDRLKAKYILNHHHRQAA